MTEQKAARASDLQVLFTRDGSYYRAYVVNKTNDNDNLLLGSIGLWALSDGDDDLKKHFELMIYALVEKLFAEMGLNAELSAVGIANE